MFWVTRCRSSPRCSSRRARATCEAGQSDVRGIRLGQRQAAAAFVVEALHQVGIGDESLGSGDSHRVVALPPALGVAEHRQAALGRDSGSGEYDDLHLPTG